MRNFVFVYTVQLWSSQCFVLLYTVTDVQSYCTDVRFYQTEWKILARNLGEKRLFV